MKEKKARVEDALHATRAAVEEGIVPGGGVALLRGQAALDAPQGRPSEQRFGVQHHPPRARGAAAPDRAATRALEGSIVVNKVREGKGDFGYNAATDTYEDLLEAGRHRPGEGRAHGAAERRQRRRPDAHHRGLVAERPKEEKAAGGGGHAGHGHGDF